ncbi:MAG: hypothetical protein HOP29_16600, partial [Phycisphaerales bacterium]|nr:hypothetical protein [Phycisphaerales bacterium]
MLGPMPRRDRRMALPVLFLAAVAFMASARPSVAQPCVTPAECDDSNPCTDESCPAGTCVFANNTEPCSDGNNCTTGDVCTAGVCGGTATDCSASGDQCNVGVCNAGT